MLRSASWNGTSRPKSVTAVPNGITAKARNAGNIASDRREQVHGPVGVRRA